MNREELMAAMEASAVRPTGKRGRPSKISVEDRTDLLFTVALQVERLALADPRRGSKADAIRAVAKKYQRPLDWVSKQRNDVP